MSRPVRVTFFINSREQGGAERQMSELMRGLDPARFETDLIVCNAVDQLGMKLPARRVISLDAPGFPSAISVAQLVRALRELRPDILHTYMGWENIVGRLAARRAGVPAVVGSVRCTRLPTKHVVGEALTWRAADAIIVNSVGIRDELAARAHIPTGRIDLVENGVDLERFRPLSPEAVAAARARFEMTGRRAVVVPGRVCEQKNQHAIVRALGAMRRDGELPPDVVTLFAGRSDHLVYGSVMKALLVRERLGAQARMLGVIKDVQHLVGAADAALLPSIYEGLPNAVIESMACRVPVVVSPPANTDGLVTDGREGLVTAGTSADDIRAALRRLFALDAGALGAMAEAGAAHARERFTVARMVASTVAVYERVLAARGVDLAA